MTITDTPTSPAALRNELDDLEMAIAFAEDFEETSRARKLRARASKLRKQLDELGGAR